MSEIRTREGIKEYSGCGHRIVACSSLKGTGRGGKLKPRPARQEDRGVKRLALGIGRLRPV